jgi:hypothetical protein
MGALVCHTPSAPEARGFPGEIFAPKGKNQAKRVAGLWRAVKSLLPKIVIPFMKSADYRQGCTRLKFGAQPQKKRCPAVDCVVGVSVGGCLRGFHLSVSNRFESWKGHVLMINHGDYSGCVAALCGGAGSAENGLYAVSGKKPTLKNFRSDAHLPLLLLLAVSIAMGGCAITGSKASESSLTPTVAISLMQLPPTTLTVSGIAPVSATVSNDVANAGVDWVSMCGSAGACGTFSPTHTASGATTTFTAPIGVPAGNTVAVTALSATDHSKASAAKVIIFSTVTGVTIAQLPPSFPSGGNMSVSATVAGDPSNAGVTWKANCGGFDCTSGFVGGPTSASGASTTFNVPLPSAISAIVGGTVTLTAFATADHNFSTSAMFTVLSPISTSITQAPPNTVLTGSSNPVIAVVTDDPTNSGVTWSMTCSAAPCGSWSTNSIITSVQVASGGTATYTAPPPPLPPGTTVKHVFLQAAATASPQNATATVEISVIAPISIIITQGLVNKAIVANHNATLVATVSNDPANAGVDWAVTCATAGACGSFSPTHTVSGAPTNFTAPGAVPAGNSVTITATSTTDPTMVASEIETVTASAPPPSLLIGQWVMLLTGKDQNGGPFSLGGTIVGDGIGTITKGTLDVADLGSPFLANANTVPVAPVPISTYSIGTDGRGQINLTMDITGLGNGGGCFGACSTNVNGTNIGTIVLSVVFVSQNHALINESDAFGSGTGTLDKENISDLDAFGNGSLGLTGSYTLNLAGAEVNAPNPPYSLAGAVGFNFTGTSYRETSYIVDQSDQGVRRTVNYTSVNIPFTGAAPSASGPGEISLLGLNLGVPPMLFNLDLWLIDANHFVVTDTRDLFVTPPVIISGYMVAQPASPAISGTYAFTEAAKTASPAFIPQSAGGIFTCGSTGVLDVTPLGGTPGGTPVTVSDAPINTVCTSPVNGRGMITVSGAGTTGTGISQFAAYPTVDQSLHLIELDGGSGGTSGPSGSGVARSVTLVAPTAANFSGKYAGNFLASTPLGLEGFAGQVVPDGVSMLSGILDVNSFNAAPPLGTPSSNATLSGPFTAPSNGRFPLALKITPATGQPAPEFTNINPVCYIVDTITTGGVTVANSCLLLGTDANAVGTGILELQNTGL